EARPFIISLDGWAGTQRYAGIWTGDQTGGEWEYIRFHIPTYIGSGLSGQPNISSDMDGIFGGNNLPVNVRDFQWKTFSPMQLNMDGWGRNPKYPQALGEPAATINRWYLKFKSRLMPYTYSIAREAVDGQPMIRAMFLDDPNAYTLGTATQYQFLYGPHFLIAPIYKETRADKDGNDVRDGIYLPEGEWVDYFTGTVYKGGCILNDFEAPLWKLPILVRRGAIVPMHTPSNNPSETDAHMRRYEIFPMGETSFTEYDDDGRTQAYLAGQCVTTKIDSKLDAKHRLQLTIHPAQGSYEGFEPAKFTQLRINLSEKPKKVTVTLNGKKQPLVEKQKFFHCMTTPGSFYFGAGGTDYVTAPALFLNLRQTDIAQATIQVIVDGAVVDNSNSLLQRHGSLQAPQPRFAEAAVKARELTVAWEPVANADYYEVQFGDQPVCTAIRQTSYTFDDLQPETDYAMKVRAVNADGASDWTAAAATTPSDPLQFAIRGARAQTSCENQGGQGINHMLDFDEASVWHTKWGATAVPFDVTIDLRSVNVLDKLHYLPRPDVGNGTLLQGTLSYSMDRQQWSEPVPFTWARNADTKELTFEGNPTARFLRLHITEAVGDFGSGQQFYIFRVGGSDYYIPGDINQDGRLDENDLTSYLNYTGLRQGDGDFEGYVSKGDLNGNGLIDAYDISAVAVELETGVSSRKVPAVAGKVTVKADKTHCNAGDEVRVTLTGEGLVSVNALSLCLPYDAADYEFVGIDAPGLAQMYNMTNDRLHTSGQKALYPTFVNLGEQPYVEGDTPLMTIKLRAKRAKKFSLKVTDGMLVDKYQNVVKF
ncbi:MAG: DUF5110 domain-containing protein, partial [Bacteroidaceae bacterium]|nr:DUF5110 domain-containing protein [Bacteroidaceae bacterium]